MRDVFPPEKHAIAVYPLNNWGGLEITAIEEACVEVTTNNGERRKQAGRHKIYQTSRAVHISLCMALVIIWTNSQEYERRSSRKKRRSAAIERSNMNYVRSIP